MTAEQFLEELIVGQQIKGLDYLEAVKGEACYDDWEDNDVEDVRVSFVDAQKLLAAYHHELEPRKSQSGCYTLSVFKEKNQILIFYTGTMPVSVLLNE